MKHALLSLLVSIMVLPATAFAQTVVPDSVTPERVLEGNDLFHSGSCARCHAVLGRGQGRNGPDLSDAEWLHGGDYDSIFHTIWWGVEQDEMKSEPPFRFEMYPRGAMPWTRAQTQAITAYVWTISRHETHSFVATQAEFHAHVNGGDFDRAIATFERAASEFPGHALLTEGALNAVAYRVLGAGNVDGAIALLEFNARQHPESWNVWDSLAEGYAQKGDRVKAIELYEKSLQLNPENDNAKAKIAELRSQR
jgi:tetratricopeptide (TPR) repeat protein